MCDLISVLPNVPARNKRKRDERGREVERNRKKERQKKKEKVDWKTGDKTVREGITIHVHTYLYVPGRIDKKCVTLIIAKCSCK